MRFPVLGAIGVGLGLAAWACGSATTTNPCAPTTSITGTGTLEIERAAAPTDGVTDYALSTAQVEDLFGAGSITLTAAEADGGAGALGAQDPVAFVRMQPVSDTPGTYDLVTLGAEIAYCSSASAKLVLTATGALSGCVPSGMPVTTPLQGTVTVTSASTKSIDPAPAPAGAHVSLSASYGAKSQQCN